MAVIVKSKHRRCSEKEERPTSKKAKRERRSSDLAEPLLNQTPRLWIPPQAEKRSHSRLYNPADGSSLRTVEAFPEEKNRAYFCVGASQGHLIFLQYFASSESPCFIPFLLNPIAGTHKHPLPKIDVNVFDSPCFKNHAGEFTTGMIRDSLVHKAVLTSDPSHCESSGRFTVVLLGGEEGSRRISICAPFIDFRWSELDRADSAPYRDVCCSSDGFLFALGGNYSVDVWNMRWGEDSDSPEKVTSLAMSVPDPFPVGETDYCVSRFYLVNADVDAVPMLVARIVVEFVDGEGNVVCDPEMEPPEEGSNHPAVCPYRTVGFEVYAMDADRRNWVRAANLGGGGEKHRRALFLGGNHSVSVPAGGGIAADSIYCTDDYWERMDEDYLYGGHDNGVFRLRDGVIGRLDGEFEEEDRFDPPPSWLVPRTAAKL
ncbi:unnamed protein product [Linum trigynum]|uniref:KIB1-4 beta-propeller domain-containing protein n=1 Tax=Linum trigynum TaxID=586398 RepID=A0AAV2GLN6_9ROSI